MTAGDAAPLDAVHGAGAAWLRSALVPVALGAAVGGAWWLADSVHPHQHVHTGALFAHLGFLALGFGSVLSVDWVGTLWLLGRRTFPQVIEAATNAQLPIWAGFTGLVASGILLEPDVSRPATMVKLGLVILIGWNGAVATRLHHVLQARLPAPPSGGLLAACAVTAAVSQLGWWGASLIGFLNANAG